MSTNAITNAAHNVAQPTVVMPPAGKEQNNVSVLYNAMVAPFNKLSVRAALWYQGEVSRLIDDSSMTHLLRFLADTLGRGFQKYHHQCSARGW